MPLADLAEGAEETRITFQDTQVQPRRVITSPEWSGIDEEGRAYAAFTINVEREKPWHTLSGRMHLYLDHAWMRELGEGLPAYRPPVDHRLMLAGGRSRSTADGVAGGHAALPDAALEVVDPLRVPGQPAHAHAVPRRLGPVDEPGRTPRRSACATTTGSRRYNRNGIVVTRAVVSHRVPQGVCLMYHSKDRQIGTPRSRDRRAPRRHRERADHDRDEADAHDRRLRAALVGPELLRARPGSNRDSVTIVRRRSQEVDVLMHVRAQVAMVMNLDKCIGCHTCSVTCKQVWTNRPGHRVRLVQQRRDRARARATRASGPTRRAGTAAGSSTARAGCG